MSYDIIGDIHGHAEALKALLASMGYREQGGAWRHPQRQAVFVGDFIDRGPKQVETVDVVRRMVDDELRDRLPDHSIPEHALLGHDGGTPLFFGHYWLTGNPAQLSEKAACVDYSIAKGGKLVAYRWDGEPDLNPAGFHWIVA